MEALGIEPDLQNQRLRLLPMTGNDTYIYAIVGKWYTEIQAYERAAVRP